MAPYSMDLRTRVLRDWDAGGGRAREILGESRLGPPPAAAATGNRLNRGAQTDAVADAHPHDAAAPAGGADSRATGSDAGGAAGSPGDLREPDDPLASDRAAGDHGQKKPSAHPNKIARTSSRPCVSGSNSLSGSTPLAGYFWMKVASRRILFAGTGAVAAARESTITPRIITSIIDVRTRRVRRGSQATRGRSIAWQIRVAILATF
jgi:hypothetical protein